jgi:hypothetical protein
MVIKSILPDVFRVRVGAPLLRMVAPLVRVVAPLLKVEVPLVMTVVRVWRIGNQALKFITHTLVIKSNKSR